MIRDTPATPTAPATALRERPKSRIGIIFRKEWGEIFRERRTIYAVVLSPLLLTPGLFALMGVLTNSQIQKARTQTYTVGVVSAKSDMASAGLPPVPHVRWVPTTRDSAEAGIRSRHLTAALVLPSDQSARLAAGDAVPVEILEDAGAENSQKAASRLRAAFEQEGQRVTARRLAAHGLPAAFASPYAVTETPIKSGGSLATLLLSQLLPYLLIISAFSGTIYAAFDQVAGEKERGTLETLLVTPVSRRDIVLGKFAAIVCVCLLSSLLSIAGLGFAFGSGLNAFSFLAQGGVHLSAAAAGVILLALLPLSVLFAGILLAVSTYARNQKEAQTLLGPLFTLVLIPAAMSMMINVDGNRGLALVPVLNASLIIKQALSGTFDAGFIALAFAASALYAAGALALVTHLFQKESVLIKA
jgi:sodium transport system permease protein